MGNQSRKGWWFCILVIAIFSATIFLEVLLPDARGQETGSRLVYLSLLMAFLVFCTGSYLLGLWGLVSMARVRAAFDVMSVFGLFFLIWTLVVGKLGLLDATSWPSPSRTFHVLQIDRDLFLRGIKASMVRFVQGFFLAVGVALPLGMVVGWFKRLFHIVYPVAKFIAPIPPVVYIPYALILFPTINQVTIFIIFIGVFWPAFVNTIYGVAHVDKRLIEAARTLGARDRRILWKVVLPAAMPSIFAGVLIGMILGFIMLTVAETVGASEGIGYYLIYYKDVAAYDKIVADIFVIGVCVFLWTWAFDRVQAWALRWQRGIVR